jgi:hypothetical protein
MLLHRSFKEMKESCLKISGSQEFLAERDQVLEVGTCLTRYTEVSVPGV